jgi:hypothetical protein
MSIQLEHVLLPGSHLNLVALKLWMIFLNIVLQRSTEYLLSIH